MSDIAPIQGLSIDRLEAAGGVVDRPPVRTPPAADSRPIERRPDRAEFSDRARYLSRLAALPARQELVDRVRAEIAEGTYDTPEKLDQALSGLLDDLAGHL
jgi:hypothetical protein